MATLDAAIRTLILSNADVAALVGTRVRPLAMGAADVRPCIAYSIRRDPTFGTLADGAADYKPASFELAIYANSHADIETISALLVDHLDECGSTVAGVEFAPVMFEEETETEQDVPEGEELPVYLRIQSYRVLYRQVREFSSAFSLAFD